MAGNILHHIDAVSFQIHLCKKIDQEHNDAEHNRYNAHGDGHKLTAEFFGHIYLYAGAVFAKAVSQILNLALQFRVCGSGTNSRLKNQHISVIFQPFTSRW